MFNVLVTGSSGFIGNALVLALKKKGYNVKGTARHNSKKSNLKSKSIFYCNINSKTDWSKILKDIDCVIHCASQNTNISYNKKKNYERYKEVNIDGTKNLAYQSAKFGVKRFIFLSTAKIILLNKENKEIHKDHLYELSKFEGENELKKISKNTNLETTIIRPPIVYGTAVKGNFSRLIKLIEMGIPFPLGLIKNKRSFIGLDNLLDIIIKSIDHPKAADQTFFVSDDNDLSTVELITKISLAMHKPVKILSFNPFLIKIFGSLIGRSSDIEKLINSFQVDISLTKKLLNWSPPYTVNYGIEKMVNNLKSKELYD
ncbi:NAD-dependent epimerase/dehydratase family protein [Candidatus Pelagibacter sp. HIMB1593]|uniref:NAD-dependent epimerase/dehydratase family protein n=1 Tax=Candidatus Pelagibacter sp. HIMB1593 TaxID=3413355 RepID=UPI003F846759